MTDNQESKKRYALIMWKVGMDFKQVVECV